MVEELRYYHYTTVPIFCSYYVHCVSPKPLQLSGDMFLNPATVVCDELYGKQIIELCGDLCGKRIIQLCGKLHGKLITVPCGELHGKPITVLCGV